MNSRKLHKIIPAAIAGVLTIVPAIGTIQFLSQRATPVNLTAAPSIGSSSTSSASQSTSAPASAPHLSIRSPAGSGDGFEGDDAPHGRVHLNPTRTQPAAPKPSSPAASGPVHNGTFTGQAASDPFGTVQVQVTVAGGKITTVTATAPMNSPVSSSINSQAIPLLKSEVLRAQSANINTVSGATYTSQAYQQSLKSALTQAGI